MRSRQRGMQAPSQTPNYLACPENACDAANGFARHSGAWLVAASSTSARNSLHSGGRLPSNQLGEATGAAHAVVVRSLSSGGLASTVRTADQDPESVCVCDGIGRSLIHHPIPPRRRRSAPYSTVHTWCPPRDAWYRDRHRYHRSGHGESAYGDLSVVKHTVRPESACNRPRVATPRCSFTKIIHTSRLTHSATPCNLTYLYSDVLSPLDRMQRRCGRPL